MTGFSNVLHLLLDEVSSQNEIVDADTFSTGNRTHHDATMVSMEPCFAPDIHLSVSTVKQTQKYIQTHTHTHTHTNLEKRIQFNSSNYKDIRLHVVASTCTDQPCH